MSIDATILGIISLTPSSGYDMKVAFEKSEASMLSALSFGSIYPRLKHLEQEGLIEIQQSSNEGRRKRVYELTALGWQELAYWLEQPAEYPLPMRDELLLKMLFWGASGAERTTLIKHLETRREESKDVLRYLAERQSDNVSFIDEYTLLVLTYIQSKLEAELLWIENTIKQLEEPASVPLQDPTWLSVLQKARRKKAFGEE